MKYRLILLSTCLLLSNLLFPCGNSYRRNTNTDDYLKGSRLESFQFKKGFDQSVLLQELNQLTDAISADLNLFENENDKALTYLRLGKTVEAINILERLEKEKPNEYNVIANLGTAYELAGRNKEALDYIKKAMTLNTNSHHGSEWFHIQILEAKLQNKATDWWISHPVLKTSSLSKDPETIISDIVYQLKERLPFTPRPDLMMAAVLKEAGEFLIKHDKLQQSWILFKIGEEYDAEKKLNLATSIRSLEKKMKDLQLAIPDYKSHFNNASDLIEKGKNLLERGLEMVNQYDQKEKEKQVAAKKQQNILWLVIVAAILLAGAGLYFGFRKKQ